MVLRRCRQLLKSEEQALDAMHDVFVKMLIHRDRLDDRAASSLLYRTATNVCLNRIRSKKRRPEDAQSELLARIATATDDEAERNEARGVLASLFKSEPTSTGTIAVLHLHDGLTLEEVAQEVGMSVSGVRKRLRKLRASLKELEDLS